MRRTRVRDRGGEESDEENKRKRQKGERNQMRRTIGRDRRGEESDGRTRGRDRRGEESDGENKRKRQRERKEKGKRQNRRVSDLKTLKGRKRHVNCVKLCSPTTLLVLIRLVSNKRSTV